MAKVNLALLGGLRLQTDPGEPIPLSTKKAGALLAYLALHPGRAHARPKLAALLWGNRPEVQARDSLRQALSLVRKALSHVDSRALIAHDDTISLQPTALTTDAIVFGHLAAQEETESLERAIALYGGELLDGFEVAAPEFESWVTVERERFREMALGAMTKLLDHHLSNGAVEGGIRIAARLLAADPLQERVHRTLMELYCRQGRHGAALRQYRTCADLLAKELAIEPDATTKALRREILREWNQRQGTTSCTDAAANPLGDIEIEPPATPRAPERRQVTVLVCDLAGASSLAARLDPEELRALIAAYQHRCTPIISRTGGAMGKVSGTEMLAYFGHPQANEHDVERAVRAGLALVEAVSRLDFGSAGPLELRVGVATGPVVVGGFLGNGGDQQGIIGEAAQLAGSMERVAAPNTVVIAASTRQLVGNLFDCDDLGPMVLNGFSEPVPAWRVQGPSGVHSRFEALRAPTTPLIGRDEELELLLRRWRQAAKGDGRVVLLSGEPGIGKSRLTIELQERLQAEPHERLRNFCSPHHQDSELYPIITQLQRAAEFRRGDTDEQRLDKLVAMLARATDDLSEAAPLIANLLSVPTGNRYRPLDLTPLKQKEKTLRALLAQLEGLAAREPVLVVFEDVHWIDPTSLELLDLTVDRAPSLPVLLIITFRPEFAPPWIGRPQVTLLTLNRLPTTQRAEMITGITGGRELPQEIADQIIDHTDGVPLFIEELTKSVVESGIVVDAGDRYGVTGPVAPLSIPSTLQASLLARLDRLPATREVVQIGAALGRSFAHEMMSAVAQRRQQEVNDALAQLVSAELIFRRGVAPDAEYTFKHALVQDAAHGTLSRSQRQQLHNRISEVLERQFTEIVETQPDVLARHCAEAGLVDKAVRYRLKAGQQAIARGAGTEAVVQLQKGLELLSTLRNDLERGRQELPLQVALGLTLSASKGYAAPGTGRAYARARELCTQLGDAATLTSVLHGQGSFHTTRGEYIAARECAENLLRLSGKQDDSRAMLAGHLIMGLSLHFLGEFASSRHRQERVLAIYDSETYRPPPGVTTDSKVSALSFLALNLFMLGHQDQALSRAEQAVLWGRTLHHSHSLAYALWHAAALHLFRCDEKAAFDALEEATAIATQQGFSYWLAHCTMLRGHVLVTRGEATKGLALARKGCEDLKATGALIFETWDLSLLANCCEHAGRPDEAFDLLTRALDIAETRNERFVEAELHRRKGEWLLAHRRSELAEAGLCFQRALAVAQKQNAKFYQLRAATSLARLWLAQSKRDKARDLLAPIYNWFTEGLDTPVLREARKTLEELAT
ncbi:BTAD domain-containing putative transcriptional regulator [Bradyrhizobium sp. CB1650]|uniref:BTAD domain-containing putative transcriptional regulator n=1 Tax=Bradyrhizobium sp. CB1650 TaxID=3039153 RepID=UPI0024356A80|nr:BTAD domain-containing putative transcriptional regulator [Bradyrhizobium sp. CB1650]WGD52876.1 BTAD domain-containing putative transcriptional regulator [Bradyrhizobium sp. CB1650]